MTQFENNYHQNLANIFQGVDKNHDGQINAQELQSALSNGTWLPFNPQTVQLMIKMFDRRNTGSIILDEFTMLWKYVNDWQQCFHAFDQDNSGFIDAQELHMAFQTFGYRFNPQITSLMIAKFDRQKNGLLAFDDFIQCCVMLNNITDVFRGLDADRDGIITIGFEQFISIALNLI